MTRFLAVLSLAAFWPAFAGQSARVPPPLWADADNKPIPKPAKQDAAELYAIMYNSWLRHFSLEEAARAGRDKGALNVNAWDGVPDSSWFNNRIGREPLTFERLLSSLGGSPPQPGLWTVGRNDLEGYTPKLYVKDARGQTYLLKFDLPDAPERNSAAERISTLILHAAGYNVPANFVVLFRPTDLRRELKAKFVDPLARERPMTDADLADVVKRLEPDSTGYCRALASYFIEGSPLGKFKYNGVRKDDPNDIIPHELRRELRGLRVIASWINHADAGDKNTFDTFVKLDEKTGFVKHYLIDFGSTLGSGNYVNGPWRVGHEYVFDGASMGKTFFSLGAWRRPWETEGKIAFPEVGYYAAELFDPVSWRPNYPNLAFVRMDDGDAYWGARIVASFPNELIDRIVADAAYSRPEVARYVADTLKARREIVVRHWLDAVSPLEEFRLVESRLSFRDLAVDFGYAEPPSRKYRYWIEDAGGKSIAKPQPCEAAGCKLPAVLTPDGHPDSFGRVRLADVFIQSNRQDGQWSAPVRVFLGRNRRGSDLAVLGWRHGLQ